MQTPVRMTPDEANMIKDRWIREQVKEDQIDGSPSCMTCGGRIMAVTAYISVHFEEFKNACTGAGQVQQVPVPYCPNCEPEPSKSGCVHVPMMEN